MPTQRGPKRDWRRTWQAIHHQSHVAPSLCTAFAWDIFCVRVKHVSVSNCVQCVPINGTLSEQKLEETKIFFRDCIRVIRLTYLVCVTLKVLFDWQIGRAPRGNVRSATERHQNQGTIKLLVQAVGLKPKIVCQSFACYTFTMDTKGERITRERAGFLSGQYMTDGI